MRNATTHLEIMAVVIGGRRQQVPSVCFKFGISLQEIKGLREELASRLHSSVSLELIKEKEEQIRGLLEEGKTRRHSLHF